MYRIVGYANARDAEGVMIQGGTTPRHAKDSAVGVL